MSWQDNAEAVSAASTTTSITSTSVTNAFSVDALADDGGTGSFSAPSSTVIDLDGKVFDVIVAGLVDSHDISINANGVGILSIHNINGSGTIPYFVRITGVWSSAANQYVYGAATLDNQTYTGFSVSAASPVSISSQSSLTFSATLHGSSTVTQFVMKLA